MKWCGYIGFRELVETEPSIWEERIVRKLKKGDLMMNSRSLQNNNGINDDIQISNTISIIADPYAAQNMHNMLYAEFRGVKWKVVKVNEAYPRLELHLGGIYNEG